MTCIQFRAPLKAQMKTCLLALLTFAMTCLYIRVLPKGGDDR